IVAVRRDPGDRRRRSPLNLRADAGRDRPGRLLAASAERVLYTPLPISERFSMRGIDFNTLMRQVRKMQTEADKKKEELAAKVLVEGKAADGLVVAQVNGVREVV